MQEEILLKLVEKISRQKCEGQEIEVKKASDGCPRHLYDTLSSFSNQNSGGTIIFGLDETSNFEVTGVYNVQDLQHRVTQQCGEMNPIVRPLFTSVEIDGKMVVSAEIPSVDVSLRPVYYKGRGMARGACVRVGDADEKMTDLEIYGYEAFRKHYHDERRIILDSDLSFFNESRLAAYIKAIKLDRPNLSAIVSDDDIPVKMGIVRDGHPSMAGLMIFSSYPQAIFPQLCVTAVVVPTERIGVAAKNGVRFIENKQITGAIPEMLEEATSFVARNAMRSNAFAKDSKRVDRREYPLVAVREAILNALIHRDYSLYSESCPIRISIYPDRLEITNKGGLYGAAPLEELGRIDIGKRNPLIVDILECLGKTENRNSGIATMKAECEAHGLPPPEFSSCQGEFKVVFKNCCPADAVVFDRKEWERTILAFCEIPRSREDLTRFTGCTQSYTMAYLVRPILESGRLQRTNPSSVKDPDQKFVAVKSAN